MMPRPRRLFAALSLLAALAIAPVTRAQTAAVWSGASSANWSSRSNWSTGIVPITGTATAVFDSATTTSLTFSTDVEVDGLTFNAGAPAFTFALGSGRSFTLSGTGITNNSSNAPVFNVDGLLYFKNGASAGNAAISVNSGGVFDISGITGTGTSFTVGQLSGSGAFYLGDKVLVLGGDNSSSTISGVLSDGDYAGVSNQTGAALTKTGTGVLTLTGANTYTGLTTVNGGTLQLGDGGAFASAANVALANGAALAFNASSDLNNQSYVISGTGSVIQAGTGLLNLTGSNTYNGATAIRSGVLEITKLNSVSGSPTASALGSPTTAANGTIALGYGTSTGTLRYSGNAAVTTNRNIDLAGTTGGGVLEMNAGNIPGVTFTGTISSSVAGAKTLTLAGTNSAAITGVISGAEISLLKVGTNAWTLSGNNTFGGGITLNEGDLDFSNAGNLGLGTTLDFGGGALGYLSGNTTDISLRTVTFVSGTSIIDIGSSAVTFTQAIGNSGAGGYIKYGSGTLTMLGANTYTGATTVQEGVLSVSTIGNGGEASGVGAGGTAGSNLVLATATLRYTGSGASTDRLFSLMNGSGTLDSSGSGALNFTNPGDIENLDGTFTTLTLAGSNTGNNTIAGNIVDGGNTLGLAKTGASTWILNGTNTYTGGTTINNGTLRLGATGALLGGGSLLINANSAGATAWLDLNGGNGSVSTLTFAGTGSTATSSAKLTTGTGTLTLGGTVTFSATGNSLGATLSGNVALGSAARTFNIGDSTNAPIDLAVPANLSGAADLIKSGTGTLLLSGANTYTGALTMTGNLTTAAGTTISAGTLSITTLGNVNGGASSLGAPTSVTKGTIAIGATTTSATLAYTGSGSTTDRVVNLAGTTGGATLDASGTGALVFTSAFTAAGAGSKTLTLTGSSTAANEIQGAIVNNSGTNRTALTKTGTGTWALTGASTYTGVTTLNAGVLSVASLADGGTASGIGASTNAATNLVINGGTLRYTGDTQSTNRLFQVGATTAGGTATLDASGTGALTFTGTGSLTFGTNNQTRSLVLTGTNTAANTLASTIANNGTGATTLTKSGTGTWVLSGTNRYTGNTTVSAGTLRVDGALTASAVTVNDGATLGGSGTISGRTTLMSGGHLAPGDSPDTLTFTNGLAFDAGAILDLQLGTDRDQIIVSGGALSGPAVGLITLNLSDSGGFSAGTFDLIDATGASLTDFAASSFVFGTTIPGYDYALTMDGNILELTATTSAVPEPSTYALIAGAATLAFGLIRRRKLVIRGM